MSQHDWAVVGAWAFGIVFFALLFLSGGMFDE